MKYFYFIFFLSFSVAILTAQNKVQRLSCVDYSKVEINDNFWRPRMDKVASVTLNTCINFCEKQSGRIRNFEKAAYRQKSEHEGIYFDDSDVYKIMEGIAYSLSHHPDKQLEKKTDEWIGKISAAQLTDGYLNTYYALTGLEKRWTNMQNHETYIAGHMIEAAIAYYQTTGKSKFLNMAICFADHIDSTLRLAERHWISGHEEIELALVKLYHVTQNRKYIELADWFIQQRGHGYYQGDRFGDSTYYQDDKPVIDTRKVVGHSVRTMYLYTAVADIAVAKQDTSYFPALFSIWENLVGKNMYITGGIGSDFHVEGFTKDYDLPNELSYSETCSAIGMVFLNQRMNMLTGESKYIDILERALYNNVLCGLSLSGDEFFYDNRLASKGKIHRRKWFECACCPSNISRLIPSVGNYIYGTAQGEIFVNLFIGSKTKVKDQDDVIHVSQESNYPWEGNIKMKIFSEKRRKYKVYIRIPSWATDNPVPENAYYYLHVNKKKPSIWVNGKKYQYQMNKGYAVLDRKWSRGDSITIELPMEVQQVLSVDKIKENRGRVALQRGPLVYCVEHEDNDGHALNLILPDDTKFLSLYCPSLLNGIMTIQMEVPVILLSSDKKSVNTEKKQITAIPYCLWANRSVGEMQVWIPRVIQNLQIEAKQ